jgi:hypothetical protein
MKIKHQEKYKRILLLITSSVIIFFMVLILFSSPLTKYLVRKYDEKYTGRKITIGRAYVNPLTGFIHLSKLRIYELKSDSIFFSADDVIARFSILKLFSKTCEITRLTVNHPYGAIIQNKKDFNFNDLIDKFASKDNSDTLKAPVRFNILNIKIINGAFYYTEQQIPISYSIKKVNIQSTGKRWDTDTIAMQFSLLPGTGTGDMKGDVTINLKNDDYSLAVVAHKFNLNIIEQYLKDLTNYGNFSANVDANIKSDGNLTILEDVTTSGLLSINDFHFGKNPEDDYLSFNRLVVAIREVSPGEYKYMYDSISLDHPFFKYERYDSLDNVQTIFGKKGTNITAVKEDPSRFNLVIEIVNYLKAITKNFFKSDYYLNRLRIYDADLKFNDFSTSEKFSMELNQLNIIADSIDKKHNRVNISLKSFIKPFGNLSAALSIYPKDSSDFDLNYNLRKLAVSMFNPYIISSTSFPIDRGTLDFNGSWKVRNGMIQSINHLVIIDPRLSKRIRNKDTKWIPAPLIMAFIRERGNVIDYEIPIKGDLKNPKFLLSDVIFDLLGNIFIKPPETPYILTVKNIEAEIEKTLTLKWMTRQASLIPSQEKFIEKMAEFLSKNPDASITVNPQQYALKEKEYILFFEAKKKYFLVMNNKNASSFSIEDSAIVDIMSVKDSAFIHYLNLQIKDSLIFTIQEKCTSIVDSSVINTKFHQLIKDREHAFNLIFSKKDVANRIKISKSEFIVPFNGFSFYKIEYQGEIPESLIRAYKEMNELNNEAPRKKYKHDRKKYETRL